VPLLNAHPGWPEPLLAKYRSEAAENLTQSDREIMDFLSIVRDQTVDLTPFGVDGGGPHVLAPRLEGWVAACDLYNVPREARPHLVDMARSLFDGVHGRINVHGLHGFPVSQLREPTPEDLDG
jgi:hypothetical protein